jgi:hypothetical protein
VLDLVRLGIAWRSHSAVVTAALADPTVTSAHYDGYFGPTTVGDTLTRFYVFDMVAHRWDIARAVGAEANSAPLSSTSSRRVSPASARPSTWRAAARPGVEAPADADRQTRVLATLGRKA